MNETVGRVLCWAQQRLKTAGLEEAKLDARCLTAHILGLERSALLARAQDPTPANLTAQLAPLLERRIAREPLAHILGYTDFYGHSFRTDRRALVPRADSETLVDVALRLLPAEAPMMVADLGTGSGCLLLSLLAERPHATGLGLDADPRAIDLARENAAALELAGRARFLAAPWSEVADWSGADLIVSNPPYVATTVIDTLEPEVRDHDPPLALDGGADGLAAYRQIIGLVTNHARTGTPLVLEIGFDQAAMVSRLLEDAGFSGITLTRDLSGNPRVLSAVNKSP
ncbi:MAG: peptide chain release factor N(5)-glutamine methyltransferase [Pseudomonadota bacterium]